MKVPKPYPETLKEAHDEITELRKYKKQIKKSAITIALFGGLTILVVGYLLGYLDGYHTALVDFKIVAGTIFRI